MISQKEKEMEKKYRKGKHICISKYKPDNSPTIAKWSILKTPDFSDSKNRIFTLVDQKHRKILCDQLHTRKPIYLLENGKYIVDNNFIEDYDESKIYLREVEDLTGCFCDNTETHKQKLESSIDDFYSTGFNNEILAIDTADEKIEWCNQINKWVYLNIVTNFDGTFCEDNPLNMRKLTKLMDDKNILSVFSIRKGDETFLSPNMTGNMRNEIRFDRQINEWVYANIPEIEENYNNNFGDFGLTGNFHGEILKEFPKFYVGYIFRNEIEIGVSWRKSDGVCLKQDCFAYDSVDLIKLRPEVKYPIFKENPKGEIFKFVSEKFAYCVLTDDRDVYGLTSEEYGLLDVYDESWTNVNYDEKTGFYQGQPVYITSGGLPDLWFYDYGKIPFEDLTSEIPICTLKTMDFIWNSYMNIFEKGEKKNGNK